MRFHRERSFRWRISLVQNVVLTAIDERVLGLQLVLVVDAVLAGNTRAWVFGCRHISDHATPRGSPP